MHQVPADRVIAELATRLGELHRENAILKVQIQVMTEEAEATAPTPAPLLVPVSGSTTAGTLPAPALD